MILGHIRVKNNPKIKDLEEVYVESYSSEEVIGPCEFGITKSNLKKN